MARDFPDLKVGDELRIWHLRIIYDELNRWRKMRGAGLVDVDGADGTSPPTIVGYAASGLVPAQLTASLATGTIASPTSAAATLLVSTGSGAALTATGGSSITVNNTLPLTSPLASGTQVWVTVLNGLWYLMQAGCP
jgi:hypothetical protein